MLGGLAQRYEQHLKRRGLAARSIETYRRGLAHFLAFLAGRRIERADHIARETIAAYQSALYTGKSRHERPFALKTQAQFLQVVQGFLKFLVREGVLLLNPADRLEMPRTGPRHAPRNVPSEDEVERLLEACDPGTPRGLRDRAILEVLYATGVRVGELVALKLYDVDVAAGLVRVIAGKGGKDRVVPLGRLAARAVRAYLETSRPHYVRGRSVNTLFVSRRGRPLRRTDVRALIARYVALAGLDRKITPHGLRHACATHMLRGRASVRHIQELLGHRQLSTTQLYTHVEIEDLKAVHARTHPRERPRRPRSTDSTRRPRRG